jgi:hypothetical protein
MRVPAPFPMMAAYLLVHCAFPALSAEPTFAWQQEYARVTETGDIEWTPEPFRFTPARPCAT